MLCLLSLSLPSISALSVSCKVFFLSLSLAPSLFLHFNTLTQSVLLSPCFISCRLMKAQLLHLVIIVLCGCLCWCVCVCVCVCVCIMSVLPKLYSILSLHQADLDFAYSAISTPIISSTFIGTLNLLNNMLLDSKFRHTALLSTWLHMCWYLYVNPCVYCLNIMT